jgi:hypothetical protein
VHEINKEFLKGKLSEKQIVRRILKRVLGKESFVGQMTRGALSRKNLITSLLNWSSDR